MVYFDNAATTKVDEGFIEDCAKIMRDYWGNASSAYNFGKESKRLLNESREKIAETINVHPDYIIFTSGGTEANNIAINTLARKFDKCITCATEHPSILNPAKSCGFAITETDDLGDGFTMDFYTKIHSSEFGVGASYMLVNNEIGTMNLIKDMVREVHDNDGWFHTDAVQAYCQIPIDAKELGVDMMSVSGHKFGCAKGVGFLYSDVPPFNMMKGGGQEKNRRSGTENLPYIYAMANLAVKKHKNLIDSSSYIKELRNYALDMIMTEIPKSKENIKIVSNGNNIYYSPSILSLTFRGINAQTLISLLDLSGFCVSAGSACSSFENKPSHVLKAIGLSDDDCRSTIRMTFSEDNTKEEIDDFIKCLKNIVTIL